MSAQVTQNRQNSFKIGFLAFTLLFCASANTLRADIGSIYEQLLRSEPGVQIADRELNVVYKSLRDRLNPDNRTQLKSAQLSWIMARDQALAATPYQQRPAVAQQWSAARVQSLSGLLSQLNGATPVSPPLIEPRPQIAQAPLPAVVPHPVEISPVEIKLAGTLSRDITTSWKDTRADTTDLPPRLSIDLVDRLEQLVPWSKIDHAGVGRGRYPNLKLAYAVHQALIVKTLDLTSLEDLLDQGKKLNSEDVPWVGIFQRILDKRRAKAITLQEDALSLIKGGDAQAAEARLAQAVKEYPSASLSAYSTGLMSYNKLTQDKALRAIDGDWKRPSMPDRELMGKASEQAAALRAFEGKEVLPALSSLANGFDAAGLLGKFASDYEPAGDMDQPHPIRAIQGMRQSEKYRKLKSEESIFTKPFLDRMKYLDELIGPKTKEYEKLVEQGAELEKEGKYLDAASAFRLALGIESSKELKQSIHRCESKTSGL